MNQRLICLSSQSSLTMYRKSTVFPLTIPQQAFLAKPSLIDLAISNTDMPDSNSLIEPSFKVFLSLFISPFD